MIKFSVSMRADHIFQEHVKITVLKFCAMKMYWRVEA